MSATHAALLRGVNIGAKTRIAMPDLRDLVESLGHTDVATWVNSGNVVFTPNDATRSNPDLAAEIAAALAERHSLRVPVIVRTGDELRALVANNPFPKAASQPKTLHVTFFDRVPDPDRAAALAEIERGDDDFRLAGDAIYLHYPNLISGATFAPNGLDRLLGVVTTSRNWNTVLKLIEMTNPES